MRFGGSTPRSGRTRCRPADAAKATNGSVGELAVWRIAESGKDPVERPRPIRESPTGRASTTSAELSTLVRERDARQAKNCTMIELLEPEKHALVGLSGGA